MLVGLTMTAPLPVSDELDSWEKTALEASSPTTSLVRIFRVSLTCGD
jgi:hypothetical protein